jgi:hypothetical protein
MGPSHHLTAGSQRLLVDSQRASGVSPQNELKLNPQPPTLNPAYTGAIGTAATQQTRLTWSDDQHIHNWMLHQEAVSTKLLAGQERVEALLRDSLLCREFTGSSTSTGDFSSPKRPKWSRKASVAQTQQALAALTPPASARSAPTPRRMQLLGGGMLSYTTALQAQLPHERQPSRVLQRLSPRLPHAQVVNSHRHELNVETDMLKPSLHKPLDMDLYSPRNLESKEHIFLNSPRTNSAEKDVLEANLQNGLAKTPSNCQKASESNPAKDQDLTLDGVNTQEVKVDTEGFLEEKEPNEGVEKHKEQPAKKKNFRMTQMTSNTINSEAEGDAEDGEDTNWDASSHWRKMIRKQERKLLKGKSASKSILNEDGQNPANSRLVTFIKGPIYEHAGIVLVLINAIFIGWQVQHMATTNTHLSFRQPAEISFAVLFTGEFIGKTYAWGCRLFSKVSENPDLYWNIFDLVVVMFMWLEIFMELGVIPPSDVSNMSILRILRILRLVRIVKVLRTMGTFRELRLMISAIAKGSFCLVWVIGVLGAAFYIFGVSLTQGANDVCPGLKFEEGVPHDSKLLCETFGTLGKSILTLYAAMSGGISWLDLHYALIPLGPVYVIIFLFYTIFSIFAIANIITGIFVDSAMQSSISDHESVIENQKREMEEYVQSIYQVFMDLDLDSSGTIAVREFEQVVKSDKMAAYFHALGLEITDVKSLFALMDRDRTGAIDIEEFLMGCLRLKGEARSLDLAKLSLQTEWIMECLDNLCDTISRNNNGGVQVTPTWRQQ